MKNLMPIGIAFLALGAALMIIGFIPVREKHEANVLGASLSVTTTESRRIPYAVSGTLLGVGAVLTIVGAAKRKG